MRHKEWKMGTMVERIQPVGPSNLLNNMVKVFASTGNTLPPGNLQTFCVRHESTALCRWGVFHPEVKTYAGGHHDAPRNKAWMQRLPRFPQ